MPTVNTTFRIKFTGEQYQHAKEYIEDMKKHPERVFWIGKERLSDDELILSQIAHRILSGFYNLYGGQFGSSEIVGMSNEKINGNS